MAIILTVDGVEYLYPGPGDPPGWGAEATGWAKGVTDDLADNVVRIDGSTMTGPLILNADATLPLGAVTLQQLTTAANPQFAPDSVVITDSDGYITILPNTVDGYVLTLDSGFPSWEPIPSGGFIQSTSDTTTIDLEVNAADLTAAVKDNSLTNQHINSNADIEVSKLEPSATDGYVIKTVSGNVEWAEESGSITPVDTNTIDLRFSTPNLSAYIIPGSITDGYVATAAGIQYSKLNLTGGIVNTDIAVNADIARTKIIAGTPNRLVYNAAITGIMSDLPAITASRALVSDTNGLPVASAVTAIEEGYLSGANSNIQGQLDGYGIRIQALEAGSSDFITSVDDTDTIDLTVSTGELTADLSDGYVDLINSKASTTYVDAYGVTLNTAINTKVSKSGDVMTGLLILSADPVANLGAATKQYVDAAAGATTLQGAYDGGATIEVVDGTPVQIYSDAGADGYSLLVERVGNVQSDAMYIDSYGDNGAIYVTASQGMSVNTPGNVIVSAGADPALPDAEVNVNQSPTSSTVGISLLTRYGDITIEAADDFSILSGDAFELESTAGQITFTDVDVPGGVTLGELATIAYVDGYVDTVMGAVNAKVAKAGDTMTGLLVLSADPVTALGAATKQYVDAAPGAATLQTAYNNGQTISATKTKGKASILQSTSDPFTRFEPSLAADKIGRFTNTTDGYSIIAFSSNDFLSPTGNNIFAYVNQDGYDAGLTASTNNVNVTSSIFCDAAAKTAQVVCSVGSTGAIVSLEAVTGEVRMQDSVGALNLAGIRNRLKQGGKGLHNLGIAVSVGSSALTIALKQANGSTDPSTGDSAVLIDFSGAGTTVQVAVTGALSIVVPSGATLGHTSALRHYIYIYAINNAGTVELAVSTMNNWHIAKNNSTLVSTTTIDTASDALTPIYSTTGRSNVACTLLAVVSSSQATAGTWATTPTLLNLGGFFFEWPQVATDVSFNLAPGVNWQPANAGSITGTLPGTPDDRFRGRFMKYGAGTLTIGRNGNNINGSAADLSVTSAGNYIMYEIWADGGGWRISTT